MKKICKGCNVKRPYEMFSKLKKSKDGYQVKCRKCFSIAHKKRYIPNPRVINTNKNPYSHSKEYRNEASLRFRRNNIENYIFLSTRSRSKRKSIDFDLELSDIIIPELCPYLHMPLTRKVGEGKTSFNPSIDRIDNSKGYVKGNIQIISDLANTMKRNASIEQLICFAKNILKIHDNKPTC